MIPGDPQGLPDEFYMEETLVFIDGGFLSKLSKYFGEGKYLKFNLIEFAKNIALKQNLFCKHLFYYTAPPFQSNSIKKEEQERKENYDKFIRNLKQNSSITIREGRCQKLRISDNKTIFKQKGVDSLAVMDIMSVPIKYKNIKTIILIACDSDFVPVIKSLKQLNLKVILYTYYEKSRNSIFSTSNELIKIVNKYVLISANDFEKSPLT